MKEKPADEKGEMAVDDCIKGFIIGGMIDWLASLPKEKGSNGVTVEPIILKFSHISGR
ncbi:MAG: hypothetical protein Q8K00_18370 [Syntrophales bacterium]|nr:hypothetical protein [Syntrophales bacterium]